MKEWIPRIKELVDKEKHFAVARVVKTWRSSPRPVGATMLILASGEMFGSVSGGCVETSVVRSALHVINSGEPELIHYGIADDDAWEVGLSCGGKLDVLIQPDQDFSWHSLFNAFEQKESFHLITSVENNFEQFSSLNGHYTLTDEMNEHVVSGKSSLLEKEGKLYFLHTFPRPYTLLLIGAAHLTSELLTLAAWHEFETIVIDPRDQFVKNSFRSNKADQMYAAWPQEILPKLSLNEQTFAVVLSHDPKIDDPALQMLLSSDVAYVGALGSRKTQAKRADRLLKQGVSKEKLNKLDAPIGIDIGSQSAKEIALSIMAGIIQVKNRKHN